MKKFIYTVLLLLPLSLLAQTTTENYVVQKNYKTKRTNPANLSTVPSDSLSMVVQYIDGLGRAKQTVAVKAGGNKQDIITHFAYDVLGRQVKDYLPYAETTNNGAFRTGDIALATTSFYNIAKYQSTTNPYSEKRFEASPLNRVLEQGAPGTAWLLNSTSDSDHTIKFDYQSNTSTDAVKIFDVTTVFSNNTYYPSLTGGSSTYVTGLLMKNITKDENWTSGTNHTTEEYKNKQGQVVLKRTYSDVSSVSTKHDTYYVYDDFGNLSFVLPPKANDLTITQTVLDNLCYQYKYDNRNRLVKKKIPGKEWEQIVYDKLDRPVLTRDSILGLTNNWLFTKYDELGRVVITGKTSDGNARYSIQNTIESTFPSNATPRSATSTTVDGVNLFYNYTQSYPSGTSVALFTINYYDTYVDVPAGFTAPTSVYGHPITSNTKGLATVSKVRILDTAHWITNLTYYDEKARPIYVYTTNPYLNTTDIIETKLDFTGKVLETRTTHKRTGFTDIVTIDTFTYDHADRLIGQSQCIGDSSLTSCNDPSNPTDSSYNTSMTLSGAQTIVDNNSITLLPGFHAVPTSGQSIVFSIAAGNAEQIVSNTYDALGQLENKKVGNTLASPLQSVDYAYNVRGWLTSINQDTFSDNDLFNFSLQYNNPSSGTALFNGNISQTSWNTLSTDTSTKTYTYSYDALNRITSGIDNTANYNLDAVQYDKNGNITSLQRKGHTNIGATTFGTMDNLTYTYETNSNKLKVVADSGASTFGFKDGANLSTEYTYDLNGNMITDANKGITNITYNHLNLPKVVTFNGSTITYTYDASGNKLEKKVYQNFSTGITQYAGNYVYKVYPYTGPPQEPCLGCPPASSSDVINLEFFNHPEGYVKNNSGTFSYVYQYKDHLGNIRLSYSDTNNDGSINAATEIVEESNYYPFGLKHKGYNSVVNGGNSVAQKKGFQDQMLDDELGLNWNTFKYRNYDASLARFHNIDPLADEYYYNSTYAFSENKVIQYNELEGLEATQLAFYAQQAYQGLKQAFTGAKETVVTNISNKAKAPTSTQKSKVENQRNLDASVDKMISGLVQSGLPEAPSERAVLKFEGYVGDGITVLSPLAGPFAPEVATAGSAISNASTLGLAKLDFDEGKHDEIENKAVINITTKAVKKAIKLDYVEPVGKFVFSLGVTFYKNYVAPKILEKKSEKQNEEQ